MPKSPLSTLEIPEDFVVANAPLYNTDIQHFVCNSIPDKDYFLGVCPSDNIPWDHLEEQYEKRARYGIIFNFDKEGQVGSGLQ